MSVGGDLQAGTAGTSERGTEHARTVELLARFRQARRITEALARPLTAEDQQIQSMPDASPSKWHLGHTTWFFETMVLERFVPGYRPFDQRFGFLFNSYYESLGARQERSRRGLLSRPTLPEVHRYRHVVTEMLCELLEHAALPPQALWFLEVGINHEQQHQELLLTDIKHALGTQPLRPAYAPTLVPAPGRVAPRPRTWVRSSGGLVDIGHTGPGFAFDNEQPRHQVRLEAFALASRLVTCGEYLAFVDDGGYRRPELWLSDGWRTVQQQGWHAPLYWQQESRRWSVYTLGGGVPFDPGEPVAHVSYYEADAYARWAGARLPTELEWEHSASNVPIAGNLLDRGRLHVATVGHDPADAGVQQLFGDAWEWTSSAYSPYPGYRPWPGAIGEYNGKFMCNQMVLRGGSCFTPVSHIRRTYRNFFLPEARWQVTGIRLARDE